MSGLLFSPVEAEAVRRILPAFYHEEGRFYALYVWSFKSPVGLLGLKDLTQGIKEMALMIFKPYQHHVLKARRCAQILDFISNLGTKKVILNTRLTSLQRLAQKFGFKRLHTDSVGKVWMAKEF